MSIITEEFKNRSLLRSGGNLRGIEPTGAGGAGKPPRGPAPPVSSGANAGLPVPRGQGGLPTALRGSGAGIKDMGRAQVVAATPPLKLPAPPAPPAPPGAAAAPTPAAPVPPAKAGGLRGLGAGAGALLTAIPEALNVHEVATDKDSTGADVATQVAEGAGRVGAATAGAALGAKGGAALGAFGGPLAPITVPAGGLLGGFVGGAAGYFGADKLIEGGRELLGLDPTSPVEQVAARKQQALAAKTQATADGADGADGAAEAPQSYQQMRLREMGVSDKAMAADALPEGRDTLRTKGTGEFQKLSSYGGDANLYGRASDPARPGRMNDFTGVGAPVGNSVGSGDNYYVREGKRLLAEDAARSNRGLRIGTADGELGSPEQRWGAMERDMRQRLGRSGDAPVLMRGLQRLNEARAAEMGNADSNATARRGQDIDAETRMYDTDMRSRDSALRNQTLRDNAELSANARLSAATTRAEAQRRTQDAGLAEKGYNRYIQAVDNMFTTTGENGEPIVDTAARNHFLSFVQGSDPRVTGLDPSKFNDMAPQEQMAMLQEFRTMYDINEARNATARRGNGTVTNRFTRPVEEREAAFADVTDNGLPFTDYIWSNLWGTNRNVVVDDTGQAALVSDLAVDKNGNWDADKYRTILSRLRSQQQ